jgi:hypothetical protein
MEEKGKDLGETGILATRIGVTAERAVGKSKKWDGKEVEVLEARASVLAAEKQLGDRLNMLIHYLRAGTVDSCFDENGRVSSEACEILRGF